MKNENDNIIASKFWKCISEQKWDAAKQLLSNDFEAYWPQSKEKIIGAENFRVAQAMGGNLLTIKKINLPEDRSKICDKILRSLPKWFGIESSIVDYVKDVVTMETWASYSNEELTGFISINKHNTATAEIHVIGVAESFHKQGIGKLLIYEAEKYLAEQNFIYLTVKTLSELRTDENYEKTRRFYVATGFFPVEVFKTLWGEHNPCLLMIKNIDQTKIPQKPSYIFPEYDFDQNLREQPKDTLVWEEFIAGLIEKLKHESDQLEKRRLLEYLGIACRITSRLSESERYLLSALALSSGSGNSSKVIQNLIRLAHTYQWQSEFSKAKVLFDQARSIINENDISSTLAAAYHQHFGKYYFDQGFFGLACCEFELAFKTRKEISAPQDQVKSSQLALDESKNRWNIQFDRNISIRRAGILDSEAIHNAHMTSINEICVNDHSADEIRVWGGRTFDPAFRVPAIQNQFYLVTEYENKIEGFCQLRLEIKDNIKTAHLFGFYITPKILKRKVGHALMELVFEFCRSEDVKMITLKSTITSFDFYKKYGFIKTGELTGPIRDGVMIRGYPMEMKL